MISDIERTMKYIDQLSIIMSVNMMSQGNISHIHQMFNEGNSCFDILCINLLCSCSTFSEYLLDPVQNKHFKGKGELFQEMKTICLSAAKEPKSVKKIRTIVSNHHIQSNKYYLYVTKYDDGQQHDPVEFMRAMLLCLEDWKMNFFLNMFGLRNFLNFI